MVSMPKLSGCSRRKRNELRDYEPKTARKRVNSVSPIQYIVMNYPGTNKPLTVENAMDIISRLHSLYSDFPYDIEETILHSLMRSFKNHLWEHHPNDLYIASPSSLEFFVGLIHTLLGGQNWTENLDETARVTKEALRRLSKVGKAEQISKDEWEKHPAESELTAEQKAFFFMTIHH